MRITNAMAASVTLQNIQNNAEQLQQTESQLTSGSRLQRPSDDPVGVVTALQSQDGISQAAQFQRNIDQANSWLGASEQALNGVVSALQRVRVLTVQGSNDTLSQTDRQGIQAEIGQLQQQVVQLANTKVGDQYVFSGTQTQTQSFTTAANPTYQGNDQAVQRQIAPGVSMSINIDAQGTFGAAFSALQQVQTALGQGSSTAVSTSLTQVDSALNAALTAQSQVGAKTNRLNQTRAEFDTLKLGLTSQLSQVKDVDYAAAITQFSTEQMVYQTSLKAGAQALQPSLLDYLR